MLVCRCRMCCRRGVTRVTRLSPRCHEIVTPCHRYVATCHGDVTAESHICHKLSQAVTTAVTLVTLSHRVSKHLSTCRHVDISQLVWGVGVTGVRCYGGTDTHGSSVRLRWSVSVHIFAFSRGDRWRWRTAGRSRASRRGTTNIRGNCDQRPINGHRSSHTRVSYIASHTIGSRFQHRKM